MPGSPTLSKSVPRGHKPTLTSNLKTETPVEVGHPTPLPPPAPLGLFTVRSDAPSNQWLYLPLKQGSSLLEEGLPGDMEEPRGGNSQESWYCRRLPSTEQQRVALRPFLSRKQLAGLPTVRTAGRWEGSALWEVRETNRQYARKSQNKSSFS